MSDVRRICSVLGVGPLLLFAACTDDPGTPGPSMDASADAGSHAPDARPADGPVDATEPTDATWQTPLEACLASAVPARCARCVVDDCQVVFDAAFGASGACDAFGACLAESCSPTGCVSLAIEEPCVSAFRAYAACQESCVETCTAPSCGNGVLDIGEECDGDELPATPTCEYLGYASGTLSCADDCTLDRSTCSGCDPDLCATCCADGRCQEISPSYCPTSLHACESCAPGGDCRFTGSAWECVSPLSDGSACTFDFECAGSVCSEGRCATGCAATHGACWGATPCCNAAAECDMSSPGAPPGECCLPTGAELGSSSDCGLCCFGMGCSGTTFGGWHCGPPD